MSWIKYRSALPTTAQRVRQRAAGVIHQVAEPTSRSAHKLARLKRQVQAYQPLTAERAGGGPRLADLSVVGILA